MSEELLIKDIMVKPLTISKSAAITDALDKMLDEEADPLIVTNNGSVMGTISRKAIAETLGSRKSSVVAPAKIHVANQTDEDFTIAYPDQNSDILIPLLQEYKIVVVLDNEHRLVGQVSATDLLKVMRPETIAEHVMQTAYTIRSDERVVHLRRRMLDENISKFIVMDDGEMMGIVTETDVAKAMKAFRELVDDKYQDHRIRNLLVKDIMTAPVLSVDIGEEVSAITEMIVTKNISALPVTNGGKLVGMITKQALISAL
ncbi:MAG: CBS domain-containing protein [Methanomicrobiales archaeon]|nr:CBS domain-containing protein [Methanomicrobiales archaeon]